MLIRFAGVKASMRHDEKCKISENEFFIIYSRHLSAMVPSNSSNFLIRLLRHIPNDKGPRNTTCFFVLSH